MHAISRHLLNPAMIVALVALGVASGGTAWAALLITNPDQLAANVVTSQKVAPAAITRTDIAGGAVRSGHVANGTLQGADLANQTIGAAKFKPGAVPQVYSAQVAENGLIQNGRGVEAVLRQQEGRYVVTFAHDVHDCAVVVVANNLVGRFATAMPDVNGQNPFLTNEQVAVRMFDIVGTPDDNWFSIIAAC